MTTETRPLSDVVYFDFETRSTKSIRGQVLQAYIADPLFDVICCAYAVNDGPVKLWRTYEKIPRDLRDAAKDPRYVFFGWNVSFDAHVWAFCVKRYGFPRIPGKRFRCLRAVSQSRGRPGALAGATVVLAPHCVKEKFDRRKMELLTTANSAGRFPSRRRYKDDYANFYAYCKRDVEASRETHKALANILSRDPWRLDPFEERVFHQTLRINSRGVRVDADLARRALEVVDYEAERGAKRLAKITDGEVTRPTQTARMAEWCRARHDLEISTMAAGAVARYCRDESLPRAVREMMTIRRLLGKSSVAKLRRLVANQVNGRLHNLLIYHQANTGRFASSGIQIHNLPRDAFNRDDENAAIAILRSKENLAAKLAAARRLTGSAASLASRLIRAMLLPDGDTMTIADYSGVEYVVMIWLVDDKTAMADRANGVDAYKKVATEIYDIGYDKVSSAQRFYGKIAVLGCQYGMGAAKFADTCRGNGVEITDELAKRIVDAYRRLYAANVAHWNSGAAAAVRAIQNPGATVSFGRVNFLFKNDDLLMRLPSGRLICYPQTTTEIGKYNRDEITYGRWTGNAWTRSHLSGPTLTENIVQATARDILCDGLLRIEKKGGRVLFHVHDEIVCEGLSPARTADIMRQCPSWAGGLQIDVDAAERDRYGKL